MTKQLAAILPLWSDDPVVPSELGKTDVEPLLAALSLDRSRALDGPSPDPLNSRRVRPYN